MNEKRLQLLLNIWMIFIIPLLLILLSELGSRVLTDHGFSFNYYDEVLGWRFKPNSKALIREDLSITFNNYGFRDSDWEKEKKNKRIVLLSDSYGAGVRVADDKIFPSLLEKKLGQEVLNVSVSAWSTYQHLKFSEKELLTFKPDRVVLVFSPNDIREGYPERDYGQIDLWERILWRISNSSTLFRTLQNRVWLSDYGDFQRILSLFPSEIVTKEGRSLSDEELFDSEDEIVLKAINESLNKIKKIIKICEQNKIKFAMTVLPIQSQLNVKNKMKINNLMKDSFPDHYFDIQADFFDESVDEMFLKNNYHYSVRGHEYVADQISLKLMN